jgi:uncharacterized protein (DUF169 family)
MKYDYPWMSDILRSRLGLIRPPIGISIISELQVPMPVLKSGMRFCEMWIKAMEGEVVCATVKEHTCDGGAYYLGMAPPSVEQKSGVLLSKRIKLYRSPMAAVRTNECSPKIPAGTGVATICAPLEKVGWDVDVILIICSPIAAMKLLENVTYHTGGAVTGMTGPAACSVAVAYPFISGKVNYSLGDFAARDFMRMSENEVLVSIPSDILPDIINNILEREEAFTV